MNERIAGILARMQALRGDLRQELEAELGRKREEFRYGLEQGEVRFEAERQAFNRKLRQGLTRYLRDSGAASILVSPVIYSLIIPLALLDMWLWLYQTVCFPAYGMRKVPRARYFHYDRGRLGYLNLIEKLSCDYCSYANGVAAYVREVGSRTEQYFCPIKHSHPVTSAHVRYHHFVDYGDAEGYRREIARLRQEVRELKGE